MSKSNKIATIVAILISTYLLWSWADVVNHNQWPDDGDPHPWNIVSVMFPSVEGEEP